MRFRLAPRLTTLNRIFGEFRGISQIWGEKAVKRMQRDTY